MGHPAYFEGYLSNGRYGPPASSPALPIFPRIFLIFVDVTRRLKRLAQALGLLWDRQICGPSDEGMVPRNTAGTGLLWRWPMSPTVRTERPSSRNARLHSLRMGSIANRSGHKDQSREGVPGTSH